MSINAWSETRDFHASCEVAFRPIAKWLQVLKINFPDALGYAAPTLAEDNIHLKVLDIKQQVAEFWILSQVESIDVDRDLFIPLDPRVRFISPRNPTPISAFPVDSPKTQYEFALIYKSIRRQITKRFFSKRRGWIRDLSSRPILYALGKPVQVEEPGSAQALAIWRAYYEDSIDESQYRRRLLELGRWNDLLKYSEIDRIRNTKRFSYFSVDFIESLKRWGDSELSTLAQLVLAHFYAICSAISAFFEDEAKLEHPVVAPTTPTAVLAKAQHRFNREVVALNTYWLRGAKEDTDISRAVGFSLDAGHKFARLHQRRLLRFNSRCADMLLERDLSCMKPGAFP
ncbi:hypothetical protein [Variovorax sp. N23]|uniref:hypothetical protein n=1 Tax=Variovorax sp. N23 TaxID=2980555 RepID=UPI0021CA11B9|nr:hypothetical protein [Variovorax sp. N23]MCU4119932.1 hypothetical protein [Variovorax sp. N23]